MIQEICDWIILIGAVSVAIINIIKFFAKPTSFFKRRKEEEFIENLSKALNNIMPEYFKKKDGEFEQKIKIKQEEITKQVTQDVLDRVQILFEEIKQINALQTESIEVLKQGTKDVLRQKIMTIYHKYKDIRKIPIYDREALDELYKDYKKEGGNSYIDKYYSRTLSWETIYVDQEDE